MQNPSQPARGKLSAQNERPQTPAAPAALDDELNRRLMEQLFTVGFRWQEAARILTLRENLYANSEMRQRQAEDGRLLFARWLYEQGEITEH
jgi:hypothetical protein